MNSASKFKTYEEIGRGKNSGSIIYRARQPQSLEYVAAKQTPTRIQALKTKVQVEATFLSSNVHPNILRFISWYQSNDEIWLITELCEGGSLESLLSREYHYWPEVSVESFASDIRDALHFLHLKGITFNELLGSNILVDIDGNIKLADFEFASQIVKHQPLTIEVIDKHVKSNGYLHKAPETLLPDGSHSISSDLFSFGCLLYRILFRRYPFEQFMDKSSAENLVYNDSDSEDSPDKQQTRITVRIRDYQRYAFRVIQHGEEHLFNNLIPSSYRGFPLSANFKDLLYKLLQPFPFKRITWNELASHPFFNAKIKERIKLPLEPQFLTSMRLFISNNTYPDVYHAITIQSDGKITCPKHLLANIERFEERLKEQRKLPASAPVSANDELGPGDTARTQTEGDEFGMSDHNEGVANISIKTTGLLYSTCIMQDPTIHSLAKVNVAVPFEGLDTFKSYVSTYHKALARLCRASYFSKRPGALLMIVKTDFNKDILANIGVLEKFLYQDSRTGLKLTEFALATRDFSILTEGAPVFHSFLVHAFLSALNSHLGDAYFDSRVGYGLMNRRNDLDRASAALTLFYYHFFFNPHIVGSAGASGVGSTASTAVELAVLQVWIDDVGNPRKKSEPLQNLLNALLHKPDGQSKKVFTISVATLALLLQIYLVLLKHNLLNSVLGDISKILYGIDIYNLLTLEALPYLEIEAKPIEIKEGKVPEERFLLRRFHSRILYCAFVENLALMLTSYYCASFNILPGVDQPTGAGEHPRSVLSSGVLCETDFNYFKLDLIRSYVPFERIVSGLAFVYKTIASDTYDLPVKSLCSNVVISLHNESLRIIVSALSSAITPDFLPLMIGSIKTILTHLDFTFVSKNLEMYKQILSCFIVLSFGEVMMDYFNVLELGVSGAISTDKDKHILEEQSVRRDRLTEEYRQAFAVEQLRPYSFFRGTDKAFEAHWSKPKDYRGLPFLYSHYKTFLFFYINSEATILKPYLCLALALLFFFDFNTFNVLKNPSTATNHNFYRILTESSSEPKIDLRRVVQNTIVDCSRIVNDAPSLLSDYTSIISMGMEAEGDRSNAIDKYYLNRLPGQNIRELQARLTKVKNLDIHIMSTLSITDYPQSKLESVLEASRTRLKTIRTKEKREILFRAAYINAFTLLSGAIHVYLDICAQVLKANMLQGNSINIRNSFKSIPSLQVLDEFYQSYTKPHVPFYLSRRVVLNLESCLFALANTAFNTVPPRELYETAMLTNLHQSQKQVSERPSSDAKGANAAQGAATAQESETKLIRIEGIDQAMLQQQITTADKKGSPSFFQLNPEYIQMSKLLLGITACVLNHPAHHLVRDHLFYISDTTRKVKGLTFAIMNLLKDTHNFSLFNEIPEGSTELAKVHGKDNLQLFNYAIEFFRYIRHAAATILSVSLERGRAYGFFNTCTTIDAYIKESVSFMSRLPSTKVSESVKPQEDGKIIDPTQMQSAAPEPIFVKITRDIQEVGLFMGEMVRSDEIALFTEAIVGSYHRLINSQSMLLCLFNSSQYHEVALTIVVNALRTKKLSLNPELRKYFLQSYIHGNIHTDLIIDGISNAVSDERMWQIFVANCGCTYTLEKVFPKVINPDSFEIKVEGDDIYAFLRVFNILVNATMTLDSIVTAHIKALSDPPAKPLDAFFIQQKRLALKDHLHLLTNEVFAGCNLLAFTCKVFKDYVIVGGNIYGVLPENYTSEVASLEQAAGAPAVGKDYIKRPERSALLRTEVLKLALSTFSLYTSLARVYGWSEQLAGTYFKNVFNYIVLDIQKWFAEKAEWLSTLSLRDDLMLAFIELTDSLLFYSSEFCNVIDVYQSVGQVGKAISKTVRIKLEGLKIAFGNPYSKNLPPKQWYDGVMEIED